MIIAVDFDGVLVKDNFPGIGEPNVEVVEAVKGTIRTGHEVVLWTCRADGALTAAVEWCRDHGLHFCAINDNTPSNKAKYGSMFPNGTRKVYADHYIDDHGVGYSHDGAIALLNSIGGADNDERTHEG